jgi:hypothetical protein
MRDGCARVATHQCQRGAVHLDRPRQARKLTSIGNNHFPGRGLRARGDHQPLLGVPQSVLDAPELPAGHQRPDETDREDGPDPNDLIRDSIEPTLDRALLTTLAEIGHGQLHEARSRLDVAGGDGVADGLS